MAHGFSPPGHCPVCGEPVARGARACPGCGADERAGWDEDASRYDGLDLPDEAYDNGANQGRRISGRGRFWLVVTIFVLATMILAFLFR